MVDGRRRTGVKSERQLWEGFLEQVTSVLGFGERQAVTGAGGAFQTGLQRQDSR